MNQPNNPNNSLYDLESFQSITSYNINKQNIETLSATQQRMRQLQTRLNRKQTQDATVVLQDLATNQNNKDSTIDEQIIEKLPSILTSLQDPSTDYAVDQQTEYQQVVDDKISKLQYNQDNFITKQTFSIFQNSVESILSDLVQQLELQKHHILHLEQDNQELKNEIILIKISQKKLVGPEIRFIFELQGSIFTIDERGSLFNNGPDSVAWILPRWGYAGYAPVQRHSGALRHGSAILLLPDLGEAAGCAAGPIGNPHREVPRGAAVRADWEQRAPRGSRAIRRGAAVRL